MEEFLVEALRLACKCLERVRSNGGEVCTWMDSMLFAVSQSQPTRSDIIFLSHEDEGKGRPEKMCRMIDGGKRGCGKNAHSYNNKPTTPFLCKTDMPLSLMFEYYPESFTCVWLDDSVDDSCGCGCTIVMACHMLFAFAFRTRHQLLPS